MPLKNPKIYGPNWRTISRNIRFGRAHGRCERCGVLHGQRRLFTGSIVYLTTAHLDHDERNHSATNLAALCPECHLAHDRADNLRRARQTRAKQYFQRQPCLFPP